MDASRWGENLTEAAGTASGAAVGFGEDVGGVAIPAKTGHRRGGG